MMHKNLAGILLVFMGSLTLIVAYVAGWTNSNTLLLAAWLAVVVGIVVHIAIQKRRSRY